MHALILIGKFLIHRIHQIAKLKSLPKFPIIRYSDTTTYRHERLGVLNGTAQWNETMEWNDHAYRSHYDNLPLYIYIPSTNTLKQQVGMPAVSDSI